MKTKLNGSKRRRANNGLASDDPGAQVRAALRRLEEKEREALRHLEGSIADLRASPDMPEATTDFIHHLAKIGISRMPAMGEFEVICAMTMAASVVALSCGTSPEQFVAWLRSMAASVIRATSTTKGA